MKNVYPIIIQEDKEENCYIVDVPDFDKSTKGCEKELHNSLLA